MHAYVIIFHQDSFCQARTAHLNRLHHQCSCVFHLSHLIFPSLAGRSYQLHVGQSHFLLMFSKLFLKCRLLPVVLSRPGFVVLITKVTQDLTLFWWIYRYMNKTNSFWSILQMIYIPFSALSRIFTCIRVSSWQGGLYSNVPALTSTVGICPSIFLIRMFYNTFINIFRDFY